MCFNEYKPGERFLDRLSNEKRMRLFLTGYFSAWNARNGFQEPTTHQYLVVPPPAAATLFLSLRQY